MVVIICILLGATCTISNAAVRPAAGIVRAPLVVICGAFIIAGAPMASAYLAMSVAAAGSVAVCCAPAVSAVSVTTAPAKRTTFVRIIEFSGEMGCGW